MERQSEIPKRMKRRERRTNQHMNNEYTGFFLFLIKVFEELGEKKKNITFTTS